MKILWGFTFVPRTPKITTDLQREKSAALLAFLLRAWRKEEGEVAYLLL